MIIFKHIDKAFSDKQILTDFCFEIKEGSKVQISGKSGIGKSTIFRLLLGFELPDKGEIWFNGKRLDEQTVWEVRRKIAWVSQDVNLGQGTMRQLIQESFSLKANLSYKKTAIEILPVLLKEFDLDATLLDKEIGSLSGGERQRMALVLAIMLQRKVFLLDEFTSALDKELKIKVMNYFFLRQDLTVIAISHDELQTDLSNITTLKLEA